ncbi:hypothetical protein G9A89_012907 [Geosiphon pyriformis]|nr:hypothetical protein G9A89_012907 [Geosiphon pyriformis]
MPVLLRKKKRDEANNTTEFNGVHIKEECLVEEISFNYNNRTTFNGKNTDQMPKSSCVKTKKALKKPLSKINFLSDSNDDDVLLDVLLVFSPSLKVLVDIPVKKLFTLNIDLDKLVELWQKAVVEFIQSDQADLVIVRWFILIRKDALSLPSEDNDRTIISGLLFVSIMRVLIIVDIWYSTAALDALETGGVSEANSALETVAASINEVTLDQTLANKITFFPYWEKKLTDLQTRIMAQ